MAAAIMAIALSPLLISTQAHACAACGDTLSTNWETQGVVTSSGWSIQLSNSYLNQNRQRYGNARASTSELRATAAAGGEVEDFTKTSTTITTIAYTGEDWGLKLELPYVQRTHGTFGSGWPGRTQYLTSSEKGLGDVRLLAHYSGFTDNQSSGLIVGIKLPTGSTNAYFSDGVTPLDAGLQIGTGSTDTIFGGYSSGAIDSIGWFGQLTWQHAVISKTGLAGVSYRPGDAFTLSAGVRHANFGDKFVPMLQLNVIHRNVDTGTGVPTDPITGVSVSGGTLAYLAPGVKYRLGGGVTLYGFVQLPVYQKVNSLQITPSYTVSSGVRYAF